MQKLKNNEARSKFTGSYKKKMRVMTTQGIVRKGGAVDVNCGNFVVGCDTRKLGGAQQIRDLEMVSAEPTLTTSMLTDFFSSRLGPR